jgi:glycosyltransferase involved in cell wall biosynthesis
MRIGLDGIPLTEPKAGIGHYTAELGRALARGSPSDEFEFVAPDRFRVEGGAEFARTLPPNLRVVHARSRGLRLRWWSLGLPLYTRERRLDLFHGTNYHIPVWDACPTVVTIHDLSPLLHSDTHREELVRRARLRLPAMARAATMIITDSESVRREVCEHFHLTPDRVAAVPLAPRRAFRRVTAKEAEAVRRRLGVEDDFLLFVGTVEPRKNLSTLVCAFAALMRETHLRPQLVIAGGRGWLNDELFALIMREGVRARTLFTGYVSDEDLRALYSSCALSIYPSLYEGFGLPPLEAMSCGAAVVTSRIPVLEETCGGGAARLFEPTDVQALTRALAELLADENARARLSEAGRTRASQFTWERTAARTREVYKEALGLWRAERRASAVEATVGGTR